jgi:hypothetical protein
LGIRNLRAHNQTLRAKYEGGNLPKNLSHRFTPIGIWNWELGIKKSSIRHFEEPATRNLLKRKISHKDIQSWIWVFLISYVLIHISFFVYETLLFLL